MPSATAIAGLVILFVSTVLGVVGLVTVEWEVSNSLSGVPLNSSVDPSRGLSVYKRGLWEECIAPTQPLTDEDTDCWMNMRTRVSFSVQMVRITYIFGVFYCLLSTILLVIWLFGRSCRHSTGWRHLTFFFLAQSVFLCVMPLVAFGLIVAIANNRTQRPVWRFGWSYIVSIVGALILPLPTFLMCQYGHHLDDREGIMLDKQRKNIEEYNTMEGDSYM